MRLFSRLIEDCKQAEEGAAPSFHQWGRPTIEDSDCDDTATSAGSSAVTAAGGPSDAGARCTHSSGSGSSGSVGGPAGAGGASCSATSRGGGGGAACGLSGLAAAAAFLEARDLDQAPAHSGGSDGSAGDEAFALAFDLEFDRAAAGVAAAHSGGGGGGSGGGGSAAPAFGGFCVPGAAAARAAEVEPVAWWCPGPFAGFSPPPRAAACEVVAPLWGRLELEGRA
ncbi:hypothetical protein MNEG_5985 [Monoraphidium neglectum]|uniref:Uncharacterized protein n=1 Tax=Monoraphidium neglectum TaxID=145388 RepID=A0A0D2MFS1_9CHLO|nr:hypothetical protein MNEG_5985 [Monoraphidium neglectum]KIZ01975.1 hypothetical protein MNEG_5985 [Monoraphidium neglectum]|eukprot:XP_013900994.1 hypothetical protein MNEG_5985 [Monoraphidium neglectum]